MYHLDRQRLSERALKILYLFQKIVTRRIHCFIKLSFTSPSITLLLSNVLPLYVSSSVLNCLAPCAAGRRLHYFSLYLQLSKPLSICFYLLTWNRLPHKQAFNKSAFSPCQQQRGGVAAVAGGGWQVGRAPLE